MNKGLARVVSLYRRNTLSRLPMVACVCVSMIVVPLIYTHMNAYTRTNTPTRAHTTFFIHDKGRGNQEKQAEREKC